MTTVNLQFHAAPDEAAALGLTWARAHQFTVVSERLFPTYQARLVKDSRTFESGPVDRLALCSRTPDVSASTAHEFTIRNQDCLFLSIGTLSGDGLRESALSGTSDAPATLTRWRAIFRSARAAMHAGATVRSPATDARASMPAHRHTPGAHELAERGIRMLAAGGWNEYEFADLRVATATQPSRVITQP